MKGIEKGRKKETDSLFVVGSKKNSVKKKTYTLKVLIISSNMITSQSSGTSEVFRFCFFKFTFHFYTYTATQCFGPAFFNGFMTICDNNRLKISNIQ